MNQILKNCAIFFLLIFGLNFNIYSQTVVGYFDASLNQAGTRLPQLHWNKMTDFIYGFIQPDANGNFPDPTTLSHFNTCKTYCANNNVKMHFSSGGATYSSIFLTIGQNTTATANFAKKVADIMQTHGIKGFDLDWEFPTSAAAQIAQVNILKAVNDEFVSRGKRSEWQIATAVGGETPSVGAQGVYHTDYCSAQAFQYLDHLNLMSYDIGYGISGNDPNHSSFNDAKANITDWVNKGCPMSKIVLGVPFYARHSSNRGASIYTHTYGELSNSNPATAFNADNVGDYYYNGKQTLINKVNYVMQQGGAGVMIWEVTYDRFDQYSLLDVLASAMLPFQCSAPKPDLGSDQSICGVSSITLNGGIPTASGRTFTWKNGTTTLVSASATANTYSATQSGTYTLEVNENSCFQSDEIVITSTLGVVTLGGPFELCAPVTKLLSTGLSGGGKTYVWTRNSSVIEGANTSSYTAKQAGTYQVTVSAVGCPSINASATVTSKVPSANDVVACSNGVITLTASESVNWYASASSTTILATGVTYKPNITGPVTYWISGTGSASTTYTTMKTNYSGGWQANSQVYGNKLNVLANLTLDAVSVHPENGAVKINLLSSTGTVLQTKTFATSSGLKEFALGWTLTPGIYYLNCAGTTGNIWVDNTLDASNYSIANVITVDRNAYEDWSSPYGDAYSASSNYGNFLNLKLTAGTACDKVPVNVTVNATDPNCLITSVNDIKKSDFQFYPNPSKDEFYIKTDKIYDIKIYTLNGALLESIKSTLGLNSIGQNWLPGVYFVVLNNTTFKLVKQ